MIRGFARNDIAANMVMFGILDIGTWIGFKKVPLEVQPTPRFDEVRVNVEYRGGTPEDVERSVVIPIETSLAVSLGFGLLFAATVTLILTQSAYLVMEEIIARLKTFAEWYGKPFRKGDDGLAEEPIHQ